MSKLRNVSFKILICCCSNGNGNGRVSARVKDTVFPDRSQPRHPTFAAIYHCVDETGSVAVARGIPKSAHAPVHEKHILQAIGKNPGLRTGEGTLACITSHNAACKFVREKLLYPCHLQAFICINSRSVFFLSLQVCLRLRLHLEERE